MSSLILASPAKINLALYVVGKYPNGYHRLLTLFHRISLSDTLYLKKGTKGIALTCSDSGLPCDNRNLIQRAYHLLQKKFPQLGGVSARLIKRIPVGGGLGGGSSNAASFLLGMKKLYRLPLSQREMIRLGKKLGADIPFFLKGVNQAIGKGRGDLILARPARKRKWFLLVTSSRGLSTKRLYANLEQRVQAPSRFVSLTKASRVIRITCDFLDQPNFSGVEGLLRNDLELPASRLRPSIQKIKTKISELGSPLVGMSGSGPTVFAIFSSEKEARRLARELKQRLSSSERMIVCHTF